MRRFARSGRTAAILVAIALVTLIGRGLWANGLFSSVKPGFSGVCKTIASLPGVSDIEISGGVAYIAVASARGPDGRDGIYALPLSGDARLTKLPGGPVDFHPRGIGLYRTPNGGLFLAAVNRRAAAADGNGRFSIDSFEVTGASALVAQGTVEGGLLNNPQDVAIAGPGAFYVSNVTLSKNALLRAAQSYGVMADGNILYFNGTTFSVAADGLYGVRGLLLTPDGTHLVAASLFSRALKSFSREMFSGNLTEGDSLTLSAAPEKISLDSNGMIWTAAHANLLAWRDFAGNAAKRAPSQVLRVSLSGGTPQSAEQIYANDGGEIAGASAVAASGRRLLIGSSLDGRLLDCTQ